MNQSHEQKYETNNAHLGATSGRDGETLSAGSTARNESATRLTGNNHNSLEKDFSRQNGGLYNVPVRHGVLTDFV